MLRRLDHDTLPHAGLGAVPQRLGDVCRVLDHDDNPLRHPAAEKQLRHGRESITENPGGPAAMARKERATTRWPSGRRGCRDAAQQTPCTHSKPASVNRNPACRSRRWEKALGSTITAASASASVPARPTWLIHRAPAGNALRGADAATLQTLRRQPPPADPRPASSP